MMRKKPALRILALGVLAISVVFSSGCVGGLAQLLYVIKGHKIPATYSGLENQRVAVVCVSDASAYGPDTLTNTINKVVGMKLATSVKKIDLVPPKTIEQWIDRNGWNESDFVALGNGVKADKVVAIDVGSYSIHEGRTIYKGRADLTVTVYDMAKNGRVDFILGPQQFQFPENGRPAIQTTDRKFEAVFLAKLTQHISRQFYAHDQLETIAEDASLMH